MKTIWEIIDALGQFFESYYLNVASRNIFDNEYDSLYHFIKNYAYQRQGAAQIFTTLALEVIEGRIKNETKYSEIDENKIWELYKQKARLEKINEKANPLSSDKGIFHKLKKENVDKPLARYVADLIIAGKTKQAHSLIKCRGVGNKISSLYARDIASLMISKKEIQIDKINDIYLLQPIDTWINQLYWVLIKKQDVEQIPTKKKDLEDLQKEIVNECKYHKISPIRFNQGAWFLGSVIAKDLEKLRKCTEDPGFTISLLEEHIKDRERYLRSLKEIGKNL